MARQPLAHYLAVTLCLMWFSGTTDTWAGLQIVNTGGRCFYRLTTAQLSTAPGYDGDEVVAGSRDGQICAYRYDATLQTWSLIWEYQTGGFIFDLAAGDLSTPPDGIDEIAAACADGKLYVLNSIGGLLSSFNGGAPINLGCPLYQVAIDQFGPNETDRRVVVGCTDDAKGIKSYDKTGSLKTTRTPVGSARLLASGDFDGDGNADLFSGEVSGDLPWSNLNLQWYRGVGLTTQWGSKPAWSNNLGETDKHHVECLAVNIEAGVQDELLTLKGVYQLGGATEPTLIHALADPALANLGAMLTYTCTILAAGDLKSSSSGKEILTAYGPQITLYDRTGQTILAKADTVTNCAKNGFTDAVYLSPVAPAATGRVVFASAPNGDDNLYVVDFENGNWISELHNMSGRSGRYVNVQANMADLASDIDSWDGTAAKGQSGPYPIVVVSPWITYAKRTSGVTNGINTVRDYEADYPPTQYPNLQFMMGMWMSEGNGGVANLDPRPGGGAWPRDSRMTYDLSQSDMIAIADRLENVEHVPFVVFCGHSSGPYLSVSSALAIMQHAPTYCMGFMSSESSDSKDLVTDFLSSFVCPIMDAGKTYDPPKTFTLNEKSGFWASAAADPAIRDLLFPASDPEKYRSALVPSVENSNTRTADLQLAARAGLFLDGQVGQWGCRIVSDFFDFNRNWEWEYPMTGYQHLRTLVAEMSLGASFFQLQCGEYYPSGSPTPVETEGVGQFLELLGKGAIAPPQPGQMKSISPVAINLINPTSSFDTAINMVHNFSQFSPADYTTTAFGSHVQCYWGMFPSLPNEAASYLWNRARASEENRFPAVRWGFPVVIPGRQPSDPRWTARYETNGDAFTAPALSLSAARTAIINELSSGTDSMPLVVSGVSPPADDVFWQVVENETHVYLIYLIDPGYYNPAQRSITVTSHLDGNFEIKDHLTGQSFGTLAEGQTSAAITIPAGSVRILRVVQPLMEFVSIKAEDGWVLESAQSSGAGATILGGGTGDLALRAGDDIDNKQYQAVVSFDTSALAGKQISSADLSLKCGRVTGTTPFAWAAGPVLKVDIAGPAGFGGDAALAPGDFEASAAANDIARMANPGGANSWCSTMGGFNASGLANINRTGKTQLRVYFSTPTNGNLSNDCLGFYSSESVGNEPRLSVKYGTSSNQAPSNISLQGSAIREHSPNDTLVGTLTANDPDAGDMISYSFVDPNQDAGGRFKIVGAQVRVANGALIDYATSPTHLITIRATDSEGLFVDGAFSITAIKDSSEAKRSWIRY